MCLCSTIFLCFCFSFIFFLLALPKTYSPVPSGLAYVVFLIVFICLQASAGATMLTDVTFWGLLVPFFYRDKFGLAMVCEHSRYVLLFITLLDI